MPKIDSYPIKALAAVVQEAYVHGVSTRKVDDLVRAPGMTGVFKNRLATARGYGYAAVHRHIRQFQADEAIIGFERQLAQGLHYPQLHPLVAPVP